MGKNSQGLSYELQRIRRETKNNQQIPCILQTRWKQLLALQRSQGKYKTYPPTKDTSFNHILKTLPQKNPNSAP